MIAQTLVIEIAEVEKQLEVDVKNARDVFGALDVAGHPVERVGDAGEHEVKKANVQRSTLDVQRSNGPLYVCGELEVER
jgi:hypothetical protein